MYEDATTTVKENEAFGVWVRAQQGSILSLL